MELNVKIIDILPQKSGTSQKGTDWVAQDFIGQTFGKYPQTICFSLFGEERVNVLQSLHINDEAKVNFDIESREYNGKWFTKCNAWRLSAANPTDNTNSQPTAKSTLKAQKNEPSQESVQINVVGEENESDLPF